MTVLGHKQNHRLGKIMELFFAIAALVLLVGMGSVWAALVGRNY